jgi:branched-chain amino acid transport system permease protein
VLLTQTTLLAQAVGKSLNIPALATVDLGLWRWFFFGLAMVIIMVIKPEGLFPSAARRAELRAEEEEPQPVPEPSSA